jgi:hypothetical protein
MKCEKRSSLGCKSILSSKFLSFEVKRLDLWNFGRPVLGVKFGVKFGASPKVSRALGSVRLPSSSFQERTLA